MAKKIEVTTQGWGQKRKKRGTLTISGGKDYKEKKRQRKLNKEQERGTRTKTIRGEKVKQYWNPSTRKWQNTPLKRGQNLPGATNKKYGKDKGVGPKDAKAREGDRTTWPEGDYYDTERHVPRKVDTFGQVIEEARERNALDSLDEISKYTQKTETGYKSSLPPSDIDKYSSNESKSYDYTPGLKIGHQSKAPASGAMQAEWNEAQRKAAKTLDQIGPGGPMTPEAMQALAIVAPNAKGNRQSLRVLHYFRNDPRFKDKVKAAGFHGG